MDQSTLPPVDANALPCPACGGYDYTWGTMHDQNQFFFWAQNEEAHQQLWLFGQDVRARLCNRCGNLQWFLQNLQAPPATKAEPEENLQVVENYDEEQAVFVPPEAVGLAPRHNRLGGMW